MARPAGVTFSLFGAFLTWSAFAVMISWSYQIRYDPTESLRSSDEDLIFDELLNEVSDATSSKIRFKAGDGLSRRPAVAEGSGAVLLDDDTEEPIEGSGFGGNKTSILSVPIARNSAPGASAKFRFTINVTSAKYFPSVGDPTSLEFRLLSLELQDRIELLFQDLEGNQTAVVEKLEESSGGTVARMHLTSNGFQDANEIERRIRDALVTGHLGRFNTTVEGFSFQATTESAMNVNPRGANCTADSYWCRDGGCVKMELHCDGKPECADASDEEGCEAKMVAVVVHPGSLTIQPGQRAQFFCGSGDLKHRVKWSKKGGDISQNANILEKKGSLQIKNATETDTGEYICTALRSLEGSSASVQLIVTPANETAGSAAEEPDVELSVAVIYAYEDAPAEISCDVEDENTTVNWHKIDGELPTGSTIIGGTLRIPSLSFADAGFYECRLDGVESEGAQSVAQITVMPDPKVSASLHVKSKKFPKIIPNNLTVTEGEPIGYQCISTREGVQVEWVRNVLPMPANVSTVGGNLTSASASITDTGKYYCRHKGHKSEQVATYLTVLQAPPTTPAPTTTTTTTVATTTTTLATTTIVAQRLDANSTAEGDVITVTIGEQIRVIEVDEGVTYLIRCVAPDGQAVEWTADNGQDLNDDGRGLLKIQKASRANIGLFRCRSQGNQSYSVSVDVRLSSSKRGGAEKDIQIFVSPRFYIARSGEDVTFECIGAVDPRDVRWARIGNKLPKTARIDGTKLHLNSVREIHHGLYVCYVEGAQGSSKQNAGQLLIASAHRSGSGEGGAGDEEWSNSVTVTIGGGGRSVAVERNGEISITCTGSREGQEVEWTRADGQPLAPRAQLKGNTLTISSVDVRSSDQFVCSSKEGSGSDRVVVDIVVVPGRGGKFGKFIAVHIDPNPVDVAEEGDDVILDCEIADPSVLVEWSRAGFELPASTNVNERRLTITSAKTSDSGFYICRAVGGSSGSQNVAKVTVRSKRSTGGSSSPDSNTSMVAIHVVRVPSEVESVFIEEQKSIKLTCVSPDGSLVRWTRQDGRPLPSSARVNNGDLLISSPTVEDSGNYVCSLEQSPATVTHVIFTVQGKDEDESSTASPTSTDLPTSDRTATGGSASSSVVVTPAFLEVNEGSQAILECYVNGQSRTVWEKTSGSLPEGVSPYESQLVLANVQPEDAGEYVCTAIDIPNANRGSAQISVRSGQRLDEPTASPNTGSDIQLYVYPSADERKEEGDSIALDCLASDPSVRVYWERPASAEAGRPVESDSSASPGRLILDSLRASDSGIYTCRAILDSGVPSVSKNVRLTVGGDSNRWPSPTITPPIPVQPRPSSCRRDEATCMNGQCIPRSGLCNGVSDCADDSDEKNCGNKCEPTEIRCNNGKCVQKIWICDGENDCGDDTDEQDCGSPPDGSPCPQNQLLCGTGDQCYPRNFQCDGTNDCQDGTDEIGCAGPTIVTPPIPSQEVRIGDTVTVNCKAVGFPVPLISWRLNWGNVPDPPRVTATSVDGLGTLTIRNFQESDQGAYSCEAINNQNAIIATPDSIITLEGTVSDICTPPLFNAAARTPEECIRCFCSGVTQNCRSCSLYLSEISSQNPPSLVDQNGSPITGGPRVRHDPTKQEHIIENVNEILQYGSPSWALPTEFLGDRVASYGSALNYSVKFSPGGQATFFPDVVIGGNNAVLYYRSPADSPQPDAYVEYSVPFVESAWSKRPDSQPTNVDVVSREDMMQVLQDLEYIRVRVLYDTLSQYSSISKIKLGTAISIDSGRGRAAKVEQCICPPGYEGLSCERCSEGFERDAERCVQSRPVAELPVETPEPPREEECDRSGSVSPYRDSRTGQCVCKENTVGPRCDQCRSGAFNLNQLSAGGCDLCFCSGVTQECRGSNYYKDQIRIPARSAMRDGLVLANLDRTVFHTENVDYSSADNLVVLRQPIRNGALYWQLPQSLLGDRITSYGGELLVNLRVEQNDQRKPIHFQIFGNDIFLNYYSTEEVPLGQIATVRVPLTEQVWARDDGVSTTREHLLMALADLEFILVQASFEPNDNLIGLGDISLGIAQPLYNGQERTNAVELCSCPQGYRGSSCEDCDRGYTRSEGGLYLGICELCDCNGHSENCDPESGVCQNCRDGRTGKHCEIEGIPAFGMRPQVIVSVPPVHEVTAGEVVTLTCNVRSRERARVVWTRADRRPIPINAIRGADNSLVLPRIRLEDGGVYVCTASTDRPDVSSSADTRVVVHPGRAVTRPPFRPRPVQTPSPPLDRSLIVYVVPPKTKTVQVGATVQFQCVVRSPITYVAAWTKVGGKLPSRDSDVAGVLTITNAQPRDSGTYICTGSNIHLTASDRADLFVEGEPSLPEYETRPEERPEERPDVRPVLRPDDRRTPPEVRIEPYFLSVNEGAPVEFRCIATGDPTPRVTWQRGSGTFSRSAVIQNELLRIPAARSEDEGEYSCTASSPAGTNRVLTVLYVTRAEGLPEVRINAPEVRARPGESIQLRCDGSGEPAPELTWTRVDGPLPSSAIQQDGMLSIDGISEPDQGVYICTARNIKGSNQAEVRVLTYGDRPAPPVVQPYPEYEIPQPTGQPNAGDSVSGEIPPTASIEPSSVMSFEGATVEFLCVVGGVPAPAVRWYRHGGESDERHTFTNTKYTISNARSDDRGIYVCAAENSAGLVQASVVLEIESREEPRLEIYPGPSQAVQLGQSAFFQCQVMGGIPPPTLTWTRADGQPLTSKTNVAGDRPDVISFADVSAAENGQYTCTAVNKHGNASVTADLQVQGLSLPRVTITPSGPIRSVEGEYIEVECSSAEHPHVRVSWARDSVNGNRVTEPQRRLSVLRIPNASVQDSGSYVCVVENDAGSSSFSVQVHVEQAQGRLPIPTRGPEEESTSPVSAEDVRVRIEPSFLKVRRGENGRFTCVDPNAGLQQIEYIWSRADDQSLASTLVQNGNYLDFYGVTQEDAGQYVCTSRTDSSIESAYAELVVEDDGEAESPPRQDTETTSQPDETPEESSSTTAAPVVPEDKLDRGKDTIVRGQRAVLQCEGLELQPDAQVAWVRREGTMPKDHHIEGTSLVIDNVSEEDAGNYICSSDGRDSTTVVVISDVVPRFRGKRDSYAVLPTDLNKTAYFEFDLDIKFKPESANGLVLYNGVASRNREVRNGDFIALGLSDGYGEFRFDVGSGQAIIRTAQPLELNKWHHIRIKRNRTEATLTVDEEAPVSGLAPGQYMGLDLASELYVGGVPDVSKLNRNLGFAENFAGCVGAIRVGGTIHDVFKNATDKSGLEDCNTCAQQNPCQSDGICQDALTPWGYKCHCPRGYTGNNCEIQGFRCINGVCGVGRCVDTESSYECICPWGKTGVKCAEDIQINVPNFSGKSFAAYATPQNALSKLDMDLVFKARSNNDGIILYVGANENGLDDFFALAIKDKSLELSFDVGSGRALLRSMVEIQLDNWYRIHIERSNHQAQMIINDEENITGKSPGTLTGLNLNTSLYIGGVSNRIKVSSGVQVQTGFNGCVLKVEINGLLYNLTDSASVLDSANVADCGEAAGCASRPCKNGGICTEEGSSQYRCTCPDGFTGTNCEVLENTCSKLQPCVNGGTCIGTGTAYQCDCPLGFGGANCDAAVPIQQSLSLSGKGYVEFLGSLLPHTGNEADIVTLHFKTSTPNGLLFWQGQKTQVGKNRDYLSLAMRDGALVLSFELGSGPANITSNGTRFDDDQWHKVTFKRTGKKGVLSIDDDQHVFNGEARGRLSQLDTTGNIFIGGVPEIVQSTMKMNEQGWSGCIRDVEIRSSGILNLREKSLGGRNAELCIA